MKWAQCILLILLLATTTISAKGYTNWGIGPQISFNVPGKSTAKYYAITDASLGLGVNSVVNFKLGKAGDIAYNPVFDIWFRLNDWTKNGGIEYPQFPRPFDVKLVDWSINFNLFEARYYPPIGKKVKPYVGLGVASVSIYSFKEEITSSGGVSLYYNDGINAGIGANIYVGASVVTKKKHTPFFELRGSGSNSAPNTFKALIGIHFNKK